MSASNKLGKLAPEACMLVDVNERIISFQSPWLDLELEAEEIPFTYSLNALHKLSRGEIISDEDLHSDLHDILWLPFFDFMWPSHDSSPYLSTLPPSDDTEKLKLAALSYVPNITINADPLPFEAFLKSDLNAVVSKVVTASLDRNTNLCDPSTAFLAIRMEALRYESARNPKKLMENGLDALAVSNPTAFRNASVEFVRAAHLATNLCAPLIAPAILLYPEFSTEVHSFLEDERGHEVLMAHSLRALGEYEPELLPVHVEALLALGALATAVRESAFAMICLIAAFEGYTAQDEDMVAAALRKHGRDSAASGLERHLAINNDGEHHEFGKQLVTRMAPLDPLIVERAARLTLIKTYSECALVETILRTHHDMDVAS